MGKVIADLATSAASATFAVENATSSVDYVLSGTDGSANDHLKTDGSGNLAWVTPTGGLFSSYAIIADVKADGVNAGGITSGAWRQRDLNTEIADPDGIVSISANDFTLAAGSYLIEWSATVQDTGRSQTRLYDVTAGAIVANGSGQNDFAQAPPWGVTRVTPGSSNVYRIEHQVLTTVATFGAGGATSYGDVEVYTIVKIFKES